MNILQRNNMMAFYNKLLLLIVVFTSSVLCNLALVDHLPKCKKDDKHCHMLLYEKFIGILTTYGITELDIPPLDPYIAKNISISIMGMMDVVLKEGRVTGIKDCVTNRFLMDFEKKNLECDRMCNRVIVEGRYSVKSNPVIDQIFQKKIHGEGNIKMVLEKLYLDLYMPFDLVNKQYGNTYIKCKPGDATYTYDVLGPVNFSFDKVFLGDNEISEFATHFFNKNWKYIVTTFGKSFVDAFVNIHYSTIEKIFYSVATKHFITDDLCVD